MNTAATRNARRSPSTNASRTLAPPSSPTTPRFGSTPIDAIVSIVIACIILLGAWHLVKEATGVLLEMVPPHVDMEGVLEDLQSIPNVHNVHDLHVWTLTSGFVALSGHGVLDDPTHHQRVLDEIRDRMGLRGIGHVTFQLEPERLHQIVRPGTSILE